MVLWAELTEAQKEAFSSVHDEDFKEGDPRYEELIKYIDSHISCNGKPENPHLEKIVQEVQIHHHTETCTKKTDYCRFGYPRFPSNKTIIAKPIPKGKNDKETKYNTQLKKKYKDILTKVKEVLEGDTSNTQTHKHT